MDVLKGKLQLYFYLWKNKGGFIVNFAIFVISTYMSWRKDFRTFDTYSLISVVTFVISFFLLLNDFKNLRRIRMSYFYVETRKDDILSKVKIGEDEKSVKDSNYKIQRMKDSYVYFSDDVNDFLYCMSKNAIKKEYELTSQKYEVPEKIKEIVPYILFDIHGSKIIFNDKKIRLAAEITKDLLVDSSKKIRLGYTDYFSSLCTNEITAVKICKENDEQVIYDGFSLFINLKKMTLKTLGESECSNHIGTATLVFTKDKKMIITVQSPKSAQNAKKFAPSGSGSADIIDLINSEGNFFKFLINSMEREFREECGISNKKIKGKIFTVLIGYCRLLERGGKPEFFGLSYVDLESKELKLQMKEKKYISYIKKDIAINVSSPNKFLSDIEKFVRENDGELSIQLKIYIEFLKKFIKKHPDEFIKIVNGDYLKEMFSKIN